MKFRVLFQKIAQGIRSYITFSFHLNWQQFFVPLNQKVNFKSCSVIRLVIEDILFVVTLHFFKYECITFSCTELCGHQLSEHVCAWGIRET